MFRAFCLLILELVCYIITLILGSRFSLFIMLVSWLHLHAHDKSPRSSHSTLDAGCSNLSARTRHAGQRIRSRRRENIIKMSRLVPAL
ncbi:hypothetical protein FB446DRAFT_180398 [Lentinula raphanica]|nr:hypothetical protein FB446DRAFT_180398 [Lentinula raphanica]